MRRQQLIEYEDGKPVYFAGECRTLRKCPHCKSKKYSKDILIQKRIFWDNNLQKYVTRMNVGIDGAESGFSCFDCKIEIDYRGAVTFDQRGLILDEM